MNARRKVILTRRRRARRHSHRPSIWVWVLQAVAGFVALVLLLNTSVVLAAAGTAFV